MAATNERLADAARNYYTTVDHENAPRVAALFTTDATYDRPGYDQLVGRSAILHFYSADRIIENGRHTITHMVCDEPQVAVEGKFVGDLRDGSSVELNFSDFFVFRDGLIAERRTYFAVAAV